MFNTPACPGNRMNRVECVVVSPGRGLAVPPFIRGEDRRRRGERDSQEGVTNIALLLSPRSVTSFIGSEGWGATTRWMKRIRVYNFMRFFKRGQKGETRSSPSRWCWREQTGSSAANQRQRHPDRGAPGRSASQSSAARLRCTSVWNNRLSEPWTRCPFVTKCKKKLTFRRERLLGSNGRTWVHYRRGCSYLDVVLAVIFRAWSRSAGQH